MTLKLFFKRIVIFAVLRPVITRVLNCSANLFTGKHFLKEKIKVFF